MAGSVRRRAYAATSSGSAVDSSVVGTCEASAVRSHMAAASSHPEDTAGEEGQRAAAPAARREGRR
jgi:hypothetical protein